MKRTALIAFNENNKKVEELIEKLQKKIDENKSISPDEIHWGHVGDVARIVEKLDELVNPE